MGSYAPIWGGFIWLTPRLWTFEHPGTHTLGTEKSLNRANPIAPEIWDGHHLCSHSASLKDSDLFGTDWSHHPGIYCQALNGTQWLCGTNLWPWLGHCTLGFTWVQG